jgi:CheY-like chemotaxis protein
VDDDAISLEILALMLGFDGHEVLQAIDGEAALDLLAASGSAGSPDVLLVDLQMPGISGHELARRVRAMRGPKPLLLGMSATTLDNRQLHGFDGFLLKPLELEELRQALGSRKHRRRPELQAGRSPVIQTRAETGNGRRRSVIDRAKRTEARTVATSAEREGINQAVLSKLRQAMSADSLNQLYTACLTDSRDRAIALRRLAHTGEMTEVSRGAHQIKGAALMVGAARIARLASALELGGCKKEDALPLLDDLLNACDQLEGMLLAGKLDQSNDDTDS